MPHDRTHRRHAPATRSGTGRRPARGAVVLAGGSDPRDAIDPTAGPAAGRAAVDAVSERGEPGYSHVELLSLARSIQAAAIVEDLGELAGTVRRLSGDLRRHVESERPSQDHLPAALRAVVFGGQDRLLRLVDGISLDVARDGACACLRRAAELLVALRRQADLEAAALRRPIDLV